VTLRKMGRPARNRPVLREVGRRSRAAGTAARPRHRHGRAHAERPRLVARRGTTPRLSARRRPPRAGRAASGRPAARPTRRTRPCRRARFAADVARRTLNPLGRSLDRSGRSCRPAPE
jgi:hypothetical protein